MNSVSRQAERASPLRLPHLVHRRCPRHNPAFCFCFSDWAIKLRNLHKSVCVNASWRWKCSDISFTLFLAGVMIWRAWNRKSNQKLWAIETMCSDAKASSCVIYFYCCKMGKSKEKKPLKWFHICSKDIWAVVKREAKESAICPQAHPELNHLNICTAPTPRAPARASTWWRCLWGNERLPWRTDKGKCEDLGFFFSCLLVKRQLAAALQEGLQRRLVNRKQAHLSESCLLWTHWQ